MEQGLKERVIGISNREQLKKVTFCQLGMVCSCHRQVLKNLNQDSSVGRILCFPQISKDETELRGRDQIAIPVHLS